MASEVYRHQEVFRTVVDECAERLQPLLGLDLRGVLYPTTEDGDRCADVLTETRIAQPALFTVEYALAKLWMHWGVVPAAMIGHSIGEYVAACVADVVTLPEALALVAMRGRLMQQQAPGAMLAVQLSVEEMMPRLDGELSLAAENAPRLSVVSGPVAAIDRLAAELTTDGKFARRLQTSHAFHSRMMEGMLPAFRAELGRVALRPPTRPYVSNLTGTWITAEQATDPDYWVAHLRQPVRFSAGIRTLLEGEVDATGSRSAPVSGDGACRCRPTRSSVSATGSNRRHRRQWRRRPRRCSRSARTSPPGSTCRDGGGRSCPGTIVCSNPTPTIACCYSTTSTASACICRGNSAPWATRSSVWRRRTVSPRWHPVSSR